MHHPLPPAPQPCVRSPSMCSPAPRARQQALPLRHTPASVSASAASAALSQAVVTAAFAAKCTFCIVVSRYHHATHGAAPRTQTLTPHDTRLRHDQREPVARLHRAGRQVRRPAQHACIAYLSVQCIALSSVSSPGRMPGPLNAASACVHRLACPGRPHLLPAWQPHQLLRGPGESVVIQVAFSHLSSHAVT